MPVATNGKGRALATRRLSDVVEAEVSWLWPDRIPYGKVTLLAGNPGVGKSYMTCAIAGFVTNGNPFPHSGGAQREPQAVLMWNGEDQAEDIVRPRARKCGANLELIEVIDGVRDDTGKVQPFSLKDVDMIVELVTQRGNIGLVVIDPISATMKGVDSHRAVEVHSALQPLIDLAKSTRIAVIIVAHLRKGESVEALYRVGGSVAFSAAPRAGLLCERDPDEPTRTTRASLKHNYSGEAQALEYGTGDEGLWFGKTSKHTAQTLLAAPKYGGVKDKAKSLLCGFLVYGPVPSAKIYETAKERGISEKAIKRAKDDLGIASEKVGGAWYFSMPETKRRTPKTFKGDSVARVEFLVLLVSLVYHPKKDKTPKIPTYARLSPLYLCFWRGLSQVFLFMPNFVRSQSLGRACLPFLTILRAANVLCRVVALYRAAIARHASRYS